MSALGPDVVAIIAISKTEFWAVHLIMQNMFSARGIRDSYLSLAVFRILD